MQQQASIGELRRCAGCQALNFVAPHLLAPLFGVPSGLYTLHHVIMHHTVGAGILRASAAQCPVMTHAQYITGTYDPAVRQEDNHARDLSSTEPYQRDNTLHFLLYAACHRLDAPSCYIHICMGLVWEQQV